MADVTVLYNGQNILELNDSRYASPNTAIFRSIYRSISIQFNLSDHKVKRIID